MITTTTTVTDYFTPCACVWGNDKLKSSFIDSGFTTLACRILYHIWHMHQGFYTIVLHPVYDFDEANCIRDFKLIGGGGVRELVFPKIEGGSDL